MNDQLSDGRYHGLGYPTPRTIDGIEKKLRQLYSSVLEEPVPPSLLEALKQLEQDHPVPRH
jgi:hypothetical protein